MNISRAFRSLSFKKLEKCNHNPGYDDSCVPCKTCGKGRLKPEDNLPPLVFDCELREDGDNELREDNTKELREN